VWGRAVTELASSIQLSGMFWASVYRYCCTPVTRRCAVLWFVCLEHVLATLFRIAVRFLLGGVLIFPYWTWVAYGVPGPSTLSKAECDSSHSLTLSLS
jgi:hypothetical protein